MAAGCSSPSSERTKGEADSLAILKGVHRRPLPHLLAGPRQCSFHQLPPGASRPVSDSGWRHMAGICLSPYFRQPVENRNEVNGMPPKEQGATAAALDSDFAIVFAPIPEAKG